MRFLISWFTKPFGLMMHPTIGEWGVINGPMFDIYHQDSFGRWIHFGGTTCLPTSPNALKKYHENIRR